MEFGGGGYCKIILLSPKKTLLFENSFVNSAERKAEGMEFNLLYCVFPNIMWIALRTKLVIISRMKSINKVQLIIPKAH